MFNRDEEDESRRAQLPLEKIEYGGEVKSKHGSPEKPKESSNYLWRNRTPEMLYEASSQKAVSRYDDGFEKDLEGNGVPGRSEGVTVTDG